MKLIRVGDTQLPLMKRAIKRYLVAIHHFVLAFCLFTRFSLFSFSVILPLLGAATVSFQLTGYQILTLVGVTFAFHSFAYVLNDIIDLPIDKHTPSRADYPLVRGQIHSKQALFFVLLQPLWAFALTIWQGGKFWACMVLGASFLFMSIYNLRGKRSSFPPLTDFAQGIAWGMLFLYGAVMTGNRVTHLTLTIFIFEVAFILLVNGVHASIRDLENDSIHGVCTTAIMFGAHSLDNKKLIIPTQLILYAALLYTVLIGLTLLPLVRNDFGYGTLSWSITFAVTLGLIFLSLAQIRKLLSLIRAEDTSDTFRKRHNIGMWQVGVLMTLPIALVIPSLEYGLQAVILAMYILPNAIVRALGPKFRKIEPEVWAG
ncbi:MAG: UbiA family prenyltransferase [Proteobacteria bacterium]|nr:UbiA family prenyltransferase [Pseudomonadota bacterium]